MKRLELLINIGVILLGAAVLFFLAKTYRATREVSQSLEEPHIGDQLPSIPGIDWKSSDRTVILALKKGCHYCEDSMPFYRQLAELSEQKALKANLVAIFPDPSADVDALVKAENLSVKTVPGVPLRSLKISGTPTVILADSSGRILQDWVGELTEHEQQQMLDTLQVPKQTPAGTATVSANCDSEKPCGVH